MAFPVHSQNVAVSSIPTDTTSDAPSPFQVTGEKIEKLRKSSMVVGITSLPDASGFMKSVYVTNSPAEYSHSSHLVAVWEKEEGLRGKMVPHIIQSQVSVEGCASCDATYFTVCDVDTDTQLGFAKVLPFLKKNNYFTGYWGINKWRDIVEVPKKYGSYGYTVNKVVVSSLEAETPAVCSVLIASIIQKFQESCEMRMLVPNLQTGSKEDKLLRLYGFKDTSESSSDEQALYLPVASNEAKILQIAINAFPIGFPKQEQEMKRA